MEKQLYDLMDWAGIEEIVYSESDNPHRLLGAHIEKEGLLIQAFIPTAKEIVVKLTGSGKLFPMELADEAGFFAVLIQRKTMADYTLLVTYDNDTVEELHDPYRYQSRFTEDDLKKFEAGIHYDIYEKMGAHPVKINGVEGVYFAVWAPCAMRVSVTGDFNLWDGRRHQMRRLGYSGIFELFIPGLKTKEIYKYEIKMRNGENVLKADPYANFAELRPNTASIVWDISQYQWTDKAWMDARETENTKDKPMAIYEVHLGSWLQKPIETDEEGQEIPGSEFYNYRELAIKLAEYIQEMGYTHIELMPVMEHPLDESWGYQVTGYYAPTSRYGTPDDFMYFMDYMHSQGIGVILDWVPAHFPKDSFGLARFDGTCVYEHMDPRQGEHPHWGTLIYNYGRPGVSNFLIANALFWAEKYHADGIRMDAVASMLYLDYGKNPGEWVANIYGGHENLEAVDFLKHLNSIFKKKSKGALLIAEESTAWPEITGDVKGKGLGFDYKWNMGWMNDFLGYMQYDPYFRCHHYGELTFSMLYAYSEDFILVFSHDEVVHGKGSMAGKMPGADLESKFANLRTAYGFMMAHPGKKLLFMGQDFGQVSEWSEKKSIEWELLKKPAHSQMKEYVKALNGLYKQYPALSGLDFHPDGFEWVNCMDYQDNIVVFLRKTKKEEETLLVVCNFAPVLHEKFDIGVPFKGKYKEIFSSDETRFGGNGLGNPRAKTSKAAECNERKNSISILIPPLSVTVFTCTPAPEDQAKGGRKKTVKNKAGIETLEEKRISRRTGKKPEAKVEAIAGETVGKVIENLEERRTRMKDQAAENKETEAVTENTGDSQAAGKSGKSGKGKATVKTGRAEEGKAGEKTERIEDKKAGEKTERIADKKAGEKTERIADKKAGEKTECIEDKKAGEKTERIVDKKAGEKTERIVDKKAGEKTERIEDKRSGRKTGRITDKKAGEKTERIEDKKAGEKTERIVDKKAGEKTERIVDKKAGEKTERIVDKKAGEKTERIEDKRAGRKTGRITDKKAGKKTERIEDKKTGERTERIEEKKTDRTEAGDPGDNGK